MIIRKRDWHLLRQTSSQKKKHKHTTIGKIITNLKKNYSIGDALKKNEVRVVIVSTPANVLSGFCPRDLSCILSLCCCCHLGIHDLFKFMHWLESLISWVSVSWSLAGSNGLQEVSVLLVQCVLCLDGRNLGSTSL